MGLQDFDVDIDPDAVDDLDDEDLKEMPDNRPKSTQSGREFRRKKMKDQGPKTASIFLRDMPSNLKAHFKAWCAKRGISMTEAVIQFMRDCVEHEGQFKGKQGKA